MPRQNLDLFALVRSHLGKGAAMESSARLNLEEAIQDKDAGRLSRANLKALRALDFMVGICHPDYAKAFRYLFGDQRLVGHLRTSDWWDADHWDEELA